MIDEIEITAEIKKELNEVLNNSAIKTPEKARAVAGRLLRRGVQPTWRLIREILGTGSATTLQKAVNQYWSELGGYLDKLEKRPDLPEKLVTEFNHVWDSALQLAEIHAKAQVEEALEKIQKIEIEINQKNESLIKKIQEEQALKIEADLQLQQLKTEYEVQQKTLEQYGKSHQRLEVIIKENKKEFSVSLSAQEQVFAEKNTQLQQTYHVLEGSLEQAQQQLAANKSQQEMSEKQSQEIIIDLKQGKQAELDRQAKQYDSMLEHYSNEIGQLKTKLEVAEKQLRNNNNKAQSQHENNLVTTTELQSNVTMLLQSNKQLEKKNKDKSSQLAIQQSELQKLIREHTKLEVRFETLDFDK
ncbi:MAG: DNA-binding protein [Cocleimonas sp.]|nr:DNA-binding protein [Cocleimonas sp.]